MGAKEYKTEVSLNVSKKRRPIITSTKLKELGYIVKTEASFMQEGQTLTLKIRRVK